MKVNEGGINMLPEPEDFGIFYHEAYKVLPAHLK